MLKRVKGRCMAAVVLLMLGPVAWADGAREGRPLAENGQNFELSVEQVLERLERYGRIDAREAEVWHSGLRQLDNVAARLELALLEIYGPESVRDPVRGLDRIEMLRDGNALPADIGRLLRVLSRHVSVQLSLQDECAEMAASLQQEQQAHAETHEKLEALRLIERQLESQLPEETSTGPASGSEEGG